MKKYTYFIGLFGLLVILLAACTPLYTSGGASTLEPAVTAQTVPTQTSIRDAQVTSVEIQSLPSNSERVNAIVRGNLSESCGTLIQPQLTYSSNTFQIKIQVSSPNDRGCLQVITPFEQTIPLDITNFGPGTYTVVANGVSNTFTIPPEPSAPVNTFQIFFYDSKHNVQAFSPSFPADIVFNPYFNSMLPAAGAAQGTVYLLDSTNGTKAIAVSTDGVRDLSFITRPSLYGLAVYPGSADSQPRLAWGTEYAQSAPNSTIQISAPDGSGEETILTQEVTEPLLQLVPEFWSADGKSLYFSKEPVGLGGYILFGGASNLYRIDVNTKEVSELIPLAPSDGPQACLDSISSDYRYVAEHCSQNFIRIRDLSSGGMANILPPEEVTTGHQLAGSARFSPDGSHIAFAVAKGAPDAEQGWVVVSETAVSNSKVILTSQAGSYYTVAGWLNDQTLVVQSTNLQDCSPYCASELSIINLDGSNPQKVADGSFITILPNGMVTTPLPTALPPAPTTGCQDAAEYLSDDGKDGTYYPPNTAFTKTWTVKNTGTCTWTSKYLVFQISGAFMTQQPGYWLLPEGQTVQPGQSVDIQVGMTTPPQKGYYESYWGLKNEAGEILPIKGGANGNSFYAKINVSDSGGENGGAVTATAIDIVPEQGSGEACTANSTYFVHAYITTDGPATVSYEIGSTAGQIAAGYFEQDSGKSPYITGTLEFDKADSKTINLRFVGPYPYPDDITVNLRVNGRDWVSTKLTCP